MLKDVDARHIRAFTPVFDGLWPGMTNRKAARREGQATLVAVEDSRLLALRGDEFVSAVTGHAASAAVADAVISSRLPSLRTTLGAA